MARHDSRSELPATRRARRRARSSSARAAASRAARPAHGRTARDATSINPDGPRPDRPADAAPPAGREASRVDGTTRDPDRRRPAALTALASLRRFVRPRPADASAASSATRRWPPSMPHLVELATRRLACACDACALLFSAGRRRGIRRVPRRVAVPARLPPDRRGLGGLHLPINLAFFLQSTPRGRRRRPLPEPRGGDRVARGGRGLGGAGRGEPGRSATSSPTSRGCWSTGSARRASITASGIDECYSWSA